MKLVFVVLTVLLIISGSAEPQRGSASSLTPSNIDRLLKNPSYVQRQIRCVLNQGQCDQVGKDLKEIIPEVVNRNCRSCNSQQAANARKVTSHIQRNYPNEWSTIVSRYRSG